MWMTVLRLPPPLQEEDDEEEVVVVVDSLAGSLGRQ